MVRSLLVLQAYTLQQAQQRAKTWAVAAAYRANAEHPVNFVKLGVK